MYACIRIIYAGAFARSGAAISVRHPAAIVVVCVARTVVGIRIVARITVAAVIIVVVIGIIGTIVIIDIRDMIAPAPRIVPTTAAVISPRIIPIVPAAAVPAPMVVCPRVVPIIPTVPTPAIPAPTYVDRPRAIPAAAPEWVVVDSLPPESSGRAVPKSIDIATAKIAHAYIGVIKSAQARFIEIVIVVIVGDVVVVIVVIVVIGNIRIAVTVTILLGCAIARIGIITWRVIYIVLGIEFAERR